MANDVDMIIEILLIIIFPPLAIWFHGRTCDVHVLINIILLLFFILAVIHALWYCFLRDDGPRQVVVIQK